MKNFYKRTNIRLAQPINCVILLDYSSPLAFSASIPAFYPLGVKGNFFLLNTYGAYLNKRAFSSSLTSMTARVEGDSHFLINSGMKASERLFSV